MFRIATILAQTHPCAHSTWESSALPEHESHSYLRFCRGPVGSRAAALALPVEPRENAAPISRHVCLPPLVEPDHWLPSAARRELDRDREIGRAALGRREHGPAEDGRDASIHFGCLVQTGCSDRRRSTVRRDRELYNDSARELWLVPPRPLVATRNSSELHPNRAQHDVWMEHARATCVDRGTDHHRGTNHSFRRGAPRHRVRRNRCDPDQDEKGLSPTTAESLVLHGRELPSRKSMRNAPSGSCRRDPVETIEASDRPPRSE